MSFFTPSTPANQTGTNTGFRFGTQTGTTTGGFGGTGTFGSTATSAPGTGSIFGSTTSAAPTTGGLFGTAASSAPATGGLFGTATSNAPTTGGLFGTAASSAPTTGGLFGTTTSSAPATGGLFGTTTSTAPATGGLFGTATSNAPATGGIFGSATSTAPATGGLFGTATSSAPGTGGIFGSTTSAAPATGGLFGSTAASSAPATGGLFGTATSTAPATGGLFGSTAPTTGGPFGGATQPAASTGPSASIRPTGDPELQEELRRIITAWDPSSPQCQLQHYLYNLVHPDEVHLYQRPPNHNETLWKQAQQDNPDPSCLVPALTVGFDDLEKRATLQRAQIAAHRQKLTEVNETLKKLRQAHDIRNAARLAEARRRQVVLCQRIIDLMRNIHILCTYGRQLRPEEEELRGRLEKLQQRLAQPGHFRSRLRELAILWEQATEHRRLAGGRLWSVTDNARLKQMERALEEQQRGITHLISVLESDTHAVNMMEHGYQMVRPH